MINIKSSTYKEVFLFLNNNLSNLYNLNLIAIKPTYDYIDLTNNTLNIIARLDERVYSYLKKYGTLDIVDNALLHNNNLDFFNIKVHNEKGMINSQYFNSCNLGNIVDKYG